MRGKSAGVTGNLRIQNCGYYIDRKFCVSVHELFTRLFTNLRSLPYETRLLRLGLLSLEERRNRGDFLEVFKMIKGFTDVPWQTFSRNEAHSTRGHSWKLAKQTCNQDYRLHFFSLRVLNRWNSLTQELVDSESVNSFKSGLEKLRKRKMGFFYGLTSDKP